MSCNSLSFAQVRELGLPYYEASHHINQCHQLNRDVLTTEETRSRYHNSEISV